MAEGTQYNWIRENMFAENKEKYSNHFLNKITRLYEYSKNKLATTNTKKGMLNQSQ